MSTSSKPLSWVLVVVARMMSLLLPVRVTGVGCDETATGLDGGDATATVLDGGDGEAGGFGAAAGAQPLKSRSA